jgi:putative transposase
MIDHPYLHRKSIRLRGYDYSLPEVYFVTLVTYQRESVLGEICNGKLTLSNFGELAKNQWISIPKHYQNITLDCWIVMPNHIHGIINITESNVGAGYQPALVKHYNLAELVRKFKTFSAMNINKSRKSPGLLVWQRNYYEHIIRDDKELNDIRQYINENVDNWKSDTENQGYLK